MKVVTSGQMRMIERIAIEEMGIPSILLMENAAINITKHCLRIIDGKQNAKVLIVCGSGSNGGDGMAIARHLHVKGTEVKVLFAGDMNAVMNDSEINLQIIKKMGIPIESIQYADNHQNIQAVIETSDLVVDAMLGTGLDRNIGGNYKILTEMINRYAKYILSVDMPSGVHSDTGRVMGNAVKASETVTLGYPKTGILTYPGAEYAGKVHVEDIGIPDALIDKVKTEANTLTADEAGNLLPERRQRSNKGNYGKILVFAGSNDMPGAAALTCSASYMTGCGLVCACVLPDVAGVIHHWQREVITRNVPEINGMYCKKSINALTEEIKNASVLVIGPGIGRSPDVTEFVHELISIAEVPIVLDADALFAVSQNMNILNMRKAPCVITPHPGEMSRLLANSLNANGQTGFSVADILDDITGTAIKFSTDFNVVTLLKDAHTIIANPDGVYYFNTTGNNALSKAGTGDVLTGMIAGFIAQGSDIFTASVLGAYFHGKSGEAAAMNMSHYSVTASDIIKNIPVAINECCKHIQSFC
ncbi:MAG: NAD(P)H-hydrate dehydratase [Treponema sp.]|nr:NAD(P)H-hydrate dehydratase [Treponema sp.]